MKNRHMCPNFGRMSFVYDADKEILRVIRLTRDDENVKLKIYERS